MKVPDVVARRMASRFRRYLATHPKDLDSEFYVDAMHAALLELRPQDALPERTPITASMLNEAIVAWRSAHGREKAILVELCVWNEVVDSLTRAGHSIHDCGLDMLTVVEDGSLEGESWRFVPRLDPLIFGASA